MFWGRGLILHLFDLFQVFPPNITISSFVYMDRNTQIDFNIVDRYSFEMNLIK